MTSLLALACGPAPQVGERQSPGAGATGSYSDLSTRIFVPRCASTACHGGNPPTVPPALEADLGYAALVGQPSLQLSMLLVEPFDPEGSYLVLKLRGTAGTAGGNPSLMPPNDPLSPADQAAVEGWIANGAPND